MLIFEQNLAYFVHTHEKALANAQLLQRRNSAQGNGATSTSPVSPPPTPNRQSSFSFLPFTSRPIQPAKLTLTPHHLFYLLSRFQELGITVGPMDVRLENIHAEAPTNYVSFLNQAQRRKQHGDSGSIHSVSSIRSAMSTMTSLWSSLGLSSKSASKIEKYKAQEKLDLKYLYSAFTMIPCLKISPDHKAPLIAGYEEFPFETAVPLFVFKNVTTLEICDVDFRQLYGWDRVAETVRSLTLKRASIDDLTDLLVNVVLDDLDKRRRRSARSAASPVVPNTGFSPKQRHAELAAVEPAQSPRLRASRTESDNSPLPGSSVDSRDSLEPRRRSASPHHPSSSRHGSAPRHGGRNSTPIRRSSGSSLDSPSATPRTSSSTLLSMGSLPYTKWRFLRHLSLSDNGLAVLPASSLMPIAGSLQSLDLSHNLFTEIPDSLATLTSLRALNLSHCMIESLQSLRRSPLPAITAVNLRNNRLTSLAGVERLLSLERIDIRENRITDPTELARLTGIPYIIDIYIHRNPFTRSFANHRVTIFNLFRSTPGYVDDVFIDGHQPSYSERKSLVERAPEPVNPPIIKRYSPEPVQAPVWLPPPVQIEEMSPRMERRSSTSSQRRRRDEPGQSSSRRKKGTRRRIVDIAQAEVFTEAAKDASPSYFTGRPSIEETPILASSPPPEALETPPPLVQSSIEESALNDLSPTSEVPPALATPTILSHPTILPPIAPHQLSTSLSTPQVPQLNLDLSALSPPPNPLQHPPLLRAGSDPTFENPVHNTPLAIESDRYRQKIEALRENFGPAWLSALTDENWDVSRGPHEGTPPGAAVMTAFGPPTSLVRTASQSIVSGGRTFG